LGSPFVDERAAICDSIVDAVCADSAYVVFLIGLLRALAASITLIDAWVLG
jgi:hypothetical protein